MDITLKSKTKSLKGHIKLNSSKSESNRALIINALSGDLCKLDNLSNARDTVTMERLLSEGENNTWDVLDAGTTMRFLTAFSAVSKKTRIMTGTDRMQQRPIKVLGDALKTLGAKIDYLNQDGYPPLKVTPLTKQLTSELEVPGDISSQYISALLMVAPILPNGLTIHIKGTIYSQPYISMTLALMDHFGVKHKWENQSVIIHHQEYKSNDYTIESDWSGASYWYSMAALADDCDLYLEGLRNISNQGDAEIVNIMKSFGVQSTFDDNGVRLSKTENILSSIKIDFKSCPDLAQTVIACAAVKGINLEMTGLESLKIKETDRIMAMKNESEKFGGILTEESDQWHFKSNPSNKSETITIETYEDHRMAMAFAPLSLKYDLTIKEKEVVNKSYPDFWRDLAKVGLEEA